MSIQEEIHSAIDDIQRKIADNNELSDNEMEMLFLAALIEEEG